jgi:hypothetical protein
MFLGPASAWNVRRHSDQLPFAPGDPLQMGLRDGWAMGGIFFDSDFEKQIQISEITHEALTNRRSAARIRSPLAPPASHSVFRVTIRHTASVTAVEIAILLIFLSGERYPHSDLSNWLTLFGIGDLGRGVYRISRSPC